MIGDDSELNGIKHSLTLIYFVKVSLIFICYCRCEMSDICLCTLENRKALFEMSAFVSDRGECVHVSACMRVLNPRPQLRNGATCY
jgi:hypothetical protein